VKLHPTSHTAKALREYDGTLGAAKSSRPAWPAVHVAPPNAIQIVNAKEHNLKNLSSTSRTTSSA
jgi:excinuclease ABC subunit A